MSEYKSFIKDFPGRCQDILDEFFERAEILDREVTLVLAIASVSILVPFERLRKPVGRVTHPSGDRSSKSFESAVGQFSNLMDREFIGSTLWPKMDAQSWSTATIQGDDVKRKPDEWEVTYSKLSDSNPRNIQLLNIIRNALAHGNIYTRPERNEEQADRIVEIIFLSRIYEDSANIDGQPATPCIQLGSFTGSYNVVSVAPADFYKFVKNWITFLGKLRIIEE